jgi:hypothetical protein
MTTTGASPTDLSSTHAAHGQPHEQSLVKPARRGEPSVVWAPSWRGPGSVCGWVVHYEQLGGAGSSMRRVASCGISWNAMVSAGTLPSLRSRWEWLPPASTKLDPAG